MDFELRIFKHNGFCEENDFIRRINCDSIIFAREEHCHLILRNAFVNVFTAILILDGILTCLCCDTDGGRLVGDNGQCHSALILE